MKVEISEEERQMILLGLQFVRVNRPGDVRPPASLMAPTDAPLDDVKRKSRDPES